MLNAGPTTPVVVEAPHDAPAGANRSLFAQYQTSPGSYLYRRPRMIYTLAGGYLLGFYGGAYRTASGARTAGAVRVDYDYDDSTANACREVFRYLPAWVPSTSGYAAANRTPQQLTTGQLAVREVQLENAGNLHDFGTLLVLGQGAGGPNLAALEVTDPMHPSIIDEWALPGASDAATAEPTIYEFPAGANMQPVVVMPSGSGGGRDLYAYSVARRGVSLLSSIRLPADTYASSAVCFDSAGRGAVTDCLVLGVNGTLVRVPVDRNGRFTRGYVDLTPAYAGLRIAGERFYTRPAVYFGNNNELNYVFGSGDIGNLATPPAVVNQLYRVKDGYNRSGAAATTANVCVADAAGSTAGAVRLGPGEVIVSPPIVARGVVAFTTYAPGVNGCVSGNSYSYAMNYETCKDAILPNAPRPTANAIGSGIPMSPSYLRATDTIIAQTAAGAITTVSVNGRGSGTNRIRGGLVPLYWRTESKAHLAAGAPRRAGAMASKLSIPDDPTAVSPVERPGGERPFPEAAATVVESREAVTLVGPREGALSIPQDATVTDPLPPQAPARPELGDAGPQPAEVPGREGAEDDEPESAKELTAIDIAVAAGLAPEPRAAASRPLDPAERRAAAPPAADLARVAFARAVGAATREPGRGAATPPARTGAAWRGVRWGRAEGRRAGRDLWLAGVTAAVLGLYLLTDERVTPLVADADGGRAAQLERVPMSWKDVPLPKVDPIPQAAEPPPHEPLPATPFTPPERPRPAARPTTLYFDESYGSGRKDRVKRSGRSARHFVHHLRPSSEEAPAPAQVAAPSEAVPKDTASGEAERVQAVRTDGGAAPTAPRAAREGAMLTIVSTPAGATVELDGEALGKTPLVRPAPKGKQSFSVRLLLEGRRPWSGTLVPNEAGNFSLSANL